MALKGSMRDFGISEILQLIGQQKKTGTLTVEDKSRKVEILMDQGNIVGAKYEPMSPAYDLGEVLVKSGLISDEQLKMAKKDHESSLKPMEQIMLNAKAVDSRELKSIKSMTTLEIIYSLFLWKTGDYSFEAGPVSYAQQWTTPISSEQVLMDGYRVKDEWPSIEKVIPNGNMILERTEADADSSDLTAEQSKVLRLVDGERTAEDIVFLSRDVSFETYKVLKELIEADVVRTAGSAIGVEQRDFTGIAIQGVALFIVILVFALALSGILSNMSRMKGRNVADKALALSETVEALHGMDRVGASLSLVRLMKGTYPEDLDQLVKMKEVEYSLITTPWGKYDYTVSDDGESCRLGLPGQTGKELSKKENRTVSGG